MIDCSRNAVMTVKSVKRYIDILEKMGYNMLMLYTEDTYEIEGREMFGALRGRYSKAELKEIVAYGEEHGIKLIPCIQTLGHLERIFRWRDFSKVRDCNGILLVDEEETYRLIDDMLKTVKECFKSSKVHIGMDEAHTLGLGRYLDLHGFTNRFEILSRHLNRVSEMVKGYGLEPMIWSDMFFRLQLEGHYLSYDNPNVITPEIAALVPDGVELVYWDYFTNYKDGCNNMMVNHNHFGRPIWFAGGALTWNGFTPHNHLAQHNWEIATECCRENGVDNIIVTCWGDDGNETSKFAVLPTLFYVAELYRGNTDKEDIKRKFKELFGVGFDDFMKLDYPNSPYKEKLHFNSPDRNLFYNDPLLPIFDDLLNEEAEGWVENYHRFRDELAELSNLEEFGYLFDTASALCDCMTVKMMLGKRTREAYVSGDKTALAAILPDYDKAIEKIDVFYNKFRRQWYKENKFTGFEVQDIRLGGLKQRLSDCKFIIEGYLSGEIDEIPELSAPVRKITDVHEERKVFKWGNIVSANIIVH